MKKLIAMIVLTALVLALPAFAAAPVVEQVKYRGSGIVEIEFTRDVSYENLTVTAADMFGAEANVTVLERDDDELDLRLENPQFEMQYTLTVSGVREGYGGSYETITADFTTPAENALFISEIDVDLEDREVDIDFLGRVEYENLAVTVTDENGNALETKIIERDGDGLELRVKGLEYGKEYEVTVTGAGLRGSGLFDGASADFIAWDD